MNKIFFMIVFFACVALPDSYAFKAKRYSLFRLISECDAIVKVSIEDSNDKFSAKVTKTYKGKVDNEFDFVPYSLRNSDRNSFNDGSPKILFLKKNMNKIELLGYGEQGIWPKIAARWPFSVSHVSSLELVEKIIEEYLLLDLTKQFDVEAFIRKQLTSNNPFFQMVGVECLEQQKFRKYIVNFSKELTKIEKKSSKDVQAKLPRLRRFID